MKFSKFFAPTLKEAPKDALLPSHIFLIRAGFIEQMGSGLYNYLPLAKIVLDKITSIVKRNLDNASSLELKFSVVSPASVWKESGRFDIFGAELLRFKDRKQNDFVLSATNEEIAVNTIKNKITSYKNLPINIYQINTKFRDEARPRFGLLRSREFIMQDGYSFHSSYEDLDKEFDLMEKTYSKIFKELGLNFRIANANSGAIGGSGSKEFMVLSKNGEDDIVVCDSCSYCANIEAACRAKKESDTKAAISLKGMDEFFTPNIKSIKDLAQFFSIDEHYIIKAVIKKAIFENDEKIVVFFVRGNDELELTKALSALKGAIELVDANEDEIKNAGIEAGFCGPYKLGVDFFIDKELEGEKNMIIGANKKDYHIVGFSVVNFNKDRFKDLVLVKNGDKCVCGGTLSITKGIEVGHIFKLGDKYSSAMNATFLDEFGKAKPFIMGCYGIGISRLLAVLVESSFDERGIIFNKLLSPFKVVIIISNLKDEESVKYAFDLYEKLQNEKIDVLIDDRNERFGIKMNDFELIGIYCALIVGKGLKNKEVELIKRKNLEKSILPADRAFEILKEELS